ncbi:MAG: hypothetical protein ACP5R4_09080 [Armatimonadota bacterium]
MRTARPNLAASEELSSRGQVRTSKSSAASKTRKVKRQILLFLALIILVAHAAWLQPLGYSAKAAEAVKRIILRR